jgi:rhamnose transport system permease protein
MGKGPLQIGRLGSIEVRGTQVILGNPFIFNKENIDRYDF